MAHGGIFAPMLAMVCITLLVWIRLYQTRLTEMRARRIAPQALASRGQASAMQDTRAADNFSNLFELPVLFYVALLVAHVTGNTGSLVLLLAWLFVVLRAVHSLIHCSYNRVMHRFSVYMLSSLVLWVLWAVLAWSALR